MENKVVVTAFLQCWIYYCITWLQPFEQSSNEKYFEKTFFAPYFLFFKYFLNVLSGITIYQFSSCFLIISTGT